MVYSPKVVKAHLRSNQLWIEQKPYRAIGLPAPARKNYDPSSSIFANQWEFRILHVAFIKSGFDRTNVAALSMAL